MKRILALLLALAMVFALAACKSDDAKDETTTAAEGEVVTDEAGEVVTDENGEAEVATEAETETNAEGEVVTEAEAEETATNAEGKPAAKPEANKPAAKPEAGKPAAGAMDAAALASFLNAETAKIARTNYNVNRHCAYTKKIDVGNKTDSLNKLIKGIDENANLDTVVGGFLGIGTIKGNAKSVDANYRMKATALKASDIQMVSASETKYVFKLANATVPQKNNGTPLARFTNDFLTKAEVAAALKDAAGSLLTLKDANVTYSNIKVTVNVANGKIASMSYDYDFSAVLDLKAAIFSVHGTGAAHTTNTFSGIKY